MAPRPFPNPAGWLRFLAGLFAAALLARWVGGLGLAPEAAAASFVAALTAWCWVTNALPLPVASLLPAGLLPLLGVAGAREVAQWYFHDVLLLLLGGFVLALALERHELHVRFAHHALRAFGTRPRRLLLGFMVTSAACSMFLSNTSTTLMMLPVALAVLSQVDEEVRPRLAVPLLLGIAYAGSIGGVGTPIGTAPNAVFLGMTQDFFPEAPPIGFGGWLVGALPLVVVFVGVAWWVLARRMGPLGRDHSVFRDLGAFGRALPRRSAEQTRVLGLFSVVVFLWVARRPVDFGPVAIPGWETLLPEAVAAGITDATIAVLGAIALFLVPGRGTRSRALLDWEDCTALPWGVLLLLGGGFAIAQAFQVSGLAAAVGEALAGTITVLPPLATAFLVALGITFLTELTSNTATITVLLPVLFGASAAAGIHPMLLALPATFAVSCAFMLPAATPPNAIAFSSGQLTPLDMARVGFRLNLVTAVLATLVGWFWTAPRWGFDLSTFPSWAATAR